MLAPDEIVLREGSPAALGALRALLGSAGIAAHITAATGCSPGG